MELGGWSCESQEVDGTRARPASRSASTSRRSVAPQDFNLLCLRCFEDSVVFGWRQGLSDIITIVVFLIFGKYREKAFGLELPQGWGHVHARTQEQIIPSSALWREAIDE